MIKKLVLRLSMMCGIMLLAHNITEAKKKPISLQEAIDIALKDNLAIQMAENTKKQAILSNRIDTFRIWTPKATFFLFCKNSWKSERNNHKKNTVQLSIQSLPVFAYTWEFSSLFDKIFQTKIYCQKNAIYKQVAKQSVEKALEQVVTAYYELALAQKKWDLSNNLLKLAAARLKVEEEKLRIGRISKVDCLDAQLAMKQVQLRLLKRKEALKTKRRSLNVVLCKPLDEEIWVQPTISVQPIWDITAVTKEQAVDLEAAIQEKQVAVAATELSRAKAYPLSCLNLSGSLQSKGYQYDLEDKGVYRDITPSKWLGSFGISMDIATLLLTPAKIKKAKMALDNAIFVLQQRKRAAEGGLEDKKSQYLHALDAYKVAEEQLKISKQKLVFIREKYRLKQVKLLELHEAEEATQKAEIGVVEHAFKVKQAEFDLYRLVGMFQQKLT